MWKNISFIVLFLVLAQCLFAADLYNNPVSVTSTKTHIIYSGKITMPTTDNAFTKWMDLMSFTEGDAYCWAVCSDVTGTEDVNAYVEYSMNCDSTATKWITSSAVNGLDALTITPKTDTLNVILGVGDPRYKLAKYFRLKFDGQTGNPATVLSWWVVLKRCPIYDLIEAPAFYYKSKAQ